MSYKFFDVHEYAKQDGYPIVNEDVQLLHELLDGVRVHKGAGICSGGEVAFFNLLPRVQRELHLVDHSYISLAYALAKYVYIEEHGSRAALELFTSKNETLVQEKLLELKDKLPEVLRTAITGEGPRYQQYYSLRYYARHLAQSWRGFPQDLVNTAAKKLSRVNFIHGDLSDLAEHGPFGLLYLSNALEHLGRHRLYPVLHELGSLVRPGGFVLLSGRQINLPSGWKELKSAEGEPLKYGEDKSPNIMTWRYGLLATPS